MEKKLPGLLVNSYGFANFTFTLMMYLALHYYSIFLTDVALIAIFHVSAIMAITHFVDVLSIPFSAGIIQNSNMRWGKFRSWLVFMPIVTCIFFTLTFTNLPLDYMYKIVFLSGAYMLAHASLNFAFNAHLSMISILAKRVEERLKLSARNIQFGMAGTILFSILVIPMLAFFSKESDTWGYFFTVLILAVIQVLGYWNLFYHSKGYEKQIPMVKGAPSSRVRLWDMILQVVANPPLLMLMMADCFVNLAFFSLSTLAVYYFKYVTGDPLWMTAYTLFHSFATFTAAFIGPYLATFMGKKKTYLFAGLYGVTGFVLLRFFGASSPIAYIAIANLAALGFGTSNPIRHAMYMDTAEYGYYKTGKDATAFVVSMFSFPIKIGIALATTIATAGLGFIGYEANMTPTPEFISNLMNIICFIPVGCGILMVVIMSFYPLADSKLPEIMEANAERKAKEAVAMGA